MGKLFHSMVIIAGLASLPVPVHALQVVEWDGGTPGAEAAAPLQAAGAAGSAALELASQHADGTPGWDRLGVQGATWGEPARADWSVAALSAAGPEHAAASARSVPAASDQDGGSPLLAGLGAVALLMWRRLRRH